MDGVGRRLGVRLGSPRLQQTRVSIPTFSGTIVAVEYHTLPGNQPHAYDNFVALWRDSIVPWGVPPQKLERIPSDDPSGSFIVTGVSITQSAYTLGYGVAGDLASVCASASILPGGQLSDPVSVSISLGFVGTNSLLVHFQTLVGYRPKSNHNWLGLWRGEAVPYSAGKPMARARVNSDSNAADVAFNGVKLTAGSVYTIVYFMSREMHSAAATLYFETTEDEMQAADSSQPGFRFREPGDV